MGDLTDTQIERYEVRRRVGAGGMGEVYEAWDPELKRRVALKRVSAGRADDPESRRRLIAEARHAARISHQGVATLHDVVHHGDDICVVMEFVEGTTLRDLETPLSLPRVLDLATQAADALAAAHRGGVVHGDIKPGNLILREDGTLKILDFGIAGLTPEARASYETTEVGPGRPGAVGWTPGYAAPEVLQGREADERSDLFCLGMVLYELLTGRHPFGRATAAGQTAAILHDSPGSIRAVNPAVSEQLERVVLRCLEKDPAARFASAAELREKLEGLREPPAEGRRRLDLAVGALLLVAVLVSALAVWEPWTDEPSAAVSDAAFDPSDWIIAVLPVLMDSGPEDEMRALNDGLAMTLTSHLAKLSDERDLQVIPASTLREEEITSLERARKELGVTLVLNFSTHRRGDQIRVNASLVDVAAPRQLDAVTVTGSAGDFLDLEQEVALAVLRMLRLELGPQERQVLDAGTDAPRAYDYFVRGQGYLADYLDVDDTRSAIQLFREALRIDPDFARAHAALGRGYWYLYELTSDPDWVVRAEDECRRAVDLDDLEAWGHLCLGTVLEGTGEPARAVESLRAALELDPTLDAAYLGLASAYESLNEPELAEETYREAITLRPHYWMGHYWLGVFLVERGRYEAAISSLREVVRLAPDSSRGYSSLGVAHYLLEDWDAARRNFERALEIDPEDSVVVNNLATLHFFRGSYAEAAGLFERAVELEPRRYTRWGHLADAYYWTPGRRQEADAAYRRAIELAEESLGVNPRDAETLSDLAFYEAMLARRDAAVEHVTRALELAPDDVLVRLYAAKVFQRLGDTGQALEHLRALVDMGYSRDEIRADPVFEELADNAEFRSLVERP